MLLPISGEEQRRGQWGRFESQKFLYYWDRSRRGKPIISIYTILLNKKVAPFALFANLLYIGTTRRTLDDDSIKGEEGNFSNTLAPFAL